MKNHAPLLLLLALAAVGQAETPAKPAEQTPPAPAAAPRPYPLKTCIVTDNDLDSMGEQTSFIHEGQVIKVCCKACIAKFKKNPAKYLRKLEPK